VEGFLTRQPNSQGAFWAFGSALRRAGVTRYPTNTRSTSRERIADLRAVGDSYLRGRWRYVRRRRHRLSVRGPLPRNIDVDLLPRFHEEWVGSEAEYPRLRQHAAVAIRTEHERHVHAGELGHLFVKERTLRAVRHRPRLFEEA